MIVTGASHGAREDVGVNAVRDVVQAAVTSGLAPCAVVGLTDSERDVWSAVAPGADPIRRDSIFLIASISKPITATAVMQLVERGQLLLDRPVASVLPEFGAQGKGDVTPWHLLTHTSGLDETRWANGRFGADQAVGDCFEEACRAPLLFRPGSQCRYCTLSFTVLAEMVSRISGRPFEEYLHDHVLVPAGMRDTSFRPSEPARRAPVHGLGDQGAGDRLVARKIPGGGLWSTAADLLAFGRVFLREGRGDRGHVLSPPSVRNMTRLHTEGLVAIADGRRDRFDYGLGWGKPGGMAGPPADASAFGHGGATGTLLWVEPKWDFAYVFLTNVWGGSDEAARRGLDAAYGAVRADGAAGEA